MSTDSRVKLGIFDSGRGGLSIARALQEQISGLELVYWADSQGFPYSTKSGEYIQSRLVVGVQALQAAGCQAIVVACNTASLYGLDTVRDVFPDLPIIGTVPALKPALESSKKNVFVLATESSIRSPKYLDFVASFSERQRVVSLGLTHLVEAIEAENSKKVETVLQQLSEQHDFRDSAVVLGCTHFPLVLDQFRTIFPQGTEFFSPTQGVVNQVKRVLSTREVNEELSLLRFISEQAQFQTAYFGQDQPSSDRLSTEL